MALDQSVVSELLVALRSGDGVDLVREAVRLVLQELIEAEATGAIGAAPYERTGTRVTERNGHQARTLATKAGDIEVGIPKLRKSSFFPQVLEPRRCIDQALYSVVMEAYVKGVSTRSVDDLVGALGVSSGISRSEVSRICQRLDEEVEAFRTRRLDHARFPYVYLDATYLHVRSDHHVVSKAAVIATGVREDGHREVLGLGVGDSEDELFWRTFLLSLKDRGLGGVKLVISDQHVGLVAAIARCFQGAAHQRCRVHFARNLLSCVPKGNQEMVAAAVRTIFAQATKEEMATQWDHVRTTLTGRFDKAARLMDGAKEKVLAFGAFPRSHWRQIWSTNPLERLNKPCRKDHHQARGPATRSHRRSRRRFASIDPWSDSAMVAPCSGRRRQMTICRASTTSSERSKCESHGSHRSGRGRLQRFAHRSGSTWCRAMQRRGGP